MVPTVVQESAAMPEATGHLASGCKTSNNQAGLGEPKTPLPRTWRSRVVITGLKTILTSKLYSGLRSGL